MSPLIKHVSLPDLALDLRVVIPNVEVESAFQAYPSGTVLLCTGGGDWQWGERFLVHEHASEDTYIAVDLARCLVQTISSLEIARHCLAILPPEDQPYPYETLEDAVAAARNSLPLFAAPASVGD
ncbi:hypothetical protein LDZ95_19045 [Pseudomonas aeruginosa]|uniref:hypothetical protein n=1 Tax=Pseudomonas aeruginosa TaxID=287 RepID=UPI0005BA9D48|nr:hypothetical protein [Pseudomonas aeruginosa]HCA1453173.1 hypothetical protein [Klebsiella pneumoniae]EKS3059474.1 hypothetical protein [Pseudomonas aeruginosa]MBG6687064.1 hypothetical protein [Pseudomonas aeruginosa]MBG6722967.1 hypothetical protein [Pseudomonas aeruginosa]MBH9013244.1 hypothetical protein [Pseudomonas aeruginosa]